MVAKVLFVAVVVSGMFAQSTMAAITINMFETSDNVVFSYSGSLDLAGLGPPVEGSSAAFIAPNAATISFGGALEDSYFGLSGPAEFGTGDVSEQAPSVVDGDPLFFSIFFFNSFSVPFGYTSGSQISGSMRFESASFDSLGIDAVSAPYVWTIDSFARDTITLQVVPEPTASLVCLAGGIAGLARRKRRPEMPSIQ